MDLKTITGKMQAIFDFLETAFEPLENRWIIFFISCFLIILFKAAGATGIALLIGLFYIMYFVTFKR